MTIIYEKVKSEAKRQDIYARTDTIQFEWDKQLQEMYRKASGEVEVNLDHANLYFVPLYNPVMKDFFRLR